MNNETNISQLVEHYFDGKLSAQEMQALEVSMQTNSALAEEFELEKTLRGAVVDANLLDWKQAIALETTKQNQIQKLKKSLVLLAVVLAGIATWYLLDNKAEIVSPVQTQELENETLVAKKETATSTSNAQTTEAKTPEVFTNEKKVVESEEIEKEPNKVVIVDSIENEPVSANNNISSPSTAQTTNEAQASPEVVSPCEGVSVSANILSEPSCENEATGSFVIGNSKGGTKPYQFKLGSGDWESRSTFTDLEAGTYTISVKDKNHCKSSFTKIIESKSCYSPELGFNPDYETWEYKSSWNDEVKVLLYDKAGRLIYETNTFDDFTWDGYNSKGEKVNTGIYRYLISNETVKIAGTVTVIH